MIETNLITKCMHMLGLQDHLKQWICLKCNAAWSERKSEAETHKTSLEERIALLAPEAETKAVENI